MNPRMKLLLLVGVVMGLGLARMTPARAQVITFTDSVTIPFSNLAFVPCANGGAGEYVDVTGNLHVVFHITISGNRFLVKASAQSQGVSGVGQSTGDKYQGNGAFESTESSGSGAFESTTVGTFRLVGQGPGNNLRIHQIIRFTFDAHGILTAYIDSYSEECG